MLHRLFISSFRIAFKNKLYYSINVFGLTVAMVTVMLIVQYLIFETSFDDFHHSPENLYRVGMEMHTEGNVSRVSTSYSGIGEGMKILFPEVRNQVLTSMDNKENGFIGAETAGGLKTLHVNGAFYVSEDFFEVFNYPITSGSREHPISKPSDIVISSALAARLFGDEDPIGKKVYWYTDESGRLPFEVSAVADEVPANAHFHFEVLMPMETFFNIHPELHQLKWVAYGFHTYIRLEEGARRENIQPLMEDFITSNLGKSYNDPVHAELFLQPMQNIHLDPVLLYESGTGGNPTTLTLLALTAVLLVVLAYTNYINLNTSIAITRAKEVGLKKVLGSSFRQLAIQFQFESLLTNLTAFSLALMVIVLTKEELPMLFSGFPEFVLFAHWQFWAVGLMAVVAFSVISSLYPIYLLHSQNSSSMIRGMFHKSQKGVGIRRNMVIFQFVIASFLIVFTLVVNQQFTFMLSQETGTAIDQILVLKRPLNLPDDFTRRYDAFRKELQQQAVVQEMALSSSIPGSLTWGTGGVRRISEAPDQGRLLTRIHVDEDYARLYNLEIIEGRDFDRAFQTDANGLLLTRKAALLIDPENPGSLIGEELIFYRDTSRVIGIIENFYHHSLKMDYQPLGLKLLPDGSYISLKLASEDAAFVLNVVEQKWQKHFPGNPFQYFFLDDHFNRTFRNEQTLSKTITFFSILALVTACLGLFGFSAFMVHQKVKEIGIRKVLGASLANLFMVLSRDMFKWVLIAYILAVPLSAWAALQWLEDFPLRIDLHWLMLITPLGLMLLFAALSIIYNVIRSSLVNPVNSLKND